MIQDEVPPTPDEYDYSFVWMSDTQYYSESYPHIYSDIVDWIAEKKDEMKIKYVTHTGDLVDEADKPEQWAVASENMKVLEDAGIPYGVLAGNHDVYGKEAAYDEYWKYFGEDRFKPQDTYGGSYDNNRGHYDLVSSHGNDYIFLYMGWGIGDEEIAWMDQVLKQYPDRMAVLNFHEYLLVSGNRAPIADKIHEQVVVPNSNVVAVLSGHYHDADLLVDAIDDNGDGTPDRNVYQMLADYQGGPEGGQGYIRLMQFDIDNNKLHIKTYSPYLDDYNFYDPEQYPGKDEFSLDLDLTPRLKRVATDYIEVNVYAKQKLGETVGAASGSNVSFDWTNLAGGASYEWYAVAEDVYGARTLSDIWKFTVAKPSGYDGRVLTPTAPQPKPQPIEGGVSIEARVEQGVAKAVVDDDAVAQAAERAQQGRIAFRVEPTAEATAVEMTLPAATLADVLRETNTDRVAIETGFATVSASREQLERLLGDGAADLRIVVANVSPDELPAETAERIGDRPVYDFEIRVDGEAVSEFSEKKGITVEMKYVLRPGEHPERIVAYFVNDAGGLEPVRLSGYDPATGTVQFAPSHFSRYTVMAAEATFGDLDGVAWAQDGIAALAAKGIVQGVQPNAFEPQRSITRAEFLKLLMDALDLAVEEAAPASGSPFHDVAPADWHYRYVVAANKLGIANGRPDGSFGAGDTITRQEIAALTQRAIEAAGVELEAPQNAAPFADRSDIAPYAVEAAAALEAAGIVTGFADGRFAPAEDATRAQAAVMIHRLLKYLMSE